MKLHYRSAFAAAFLSFACAVNAQTPDTEPFYRTSIASFDAVDKFTVDLGFPSQFNVKALVQSAFPFLPADALAGDRPFGIVFLALPDNSVNQAVAFPIVEGKITPAMLVKLGAHAVPGTANIFTLGEMSIRLAPGYVFLHQGAPEELAAVSATPFNKDAKQRDSLYLASFNLATLRKNAPAFYEQCLSGVVDVGPLASDAVSSAGQKFVRERIISVIKNVDTFTLTANVDTKSLHIKSSTGPVQAPAIKPVPRPAFPHGILMQAHLVYPDATWSSWMERTFIQFGDAIPMGDLPPEQVQKDKSLFRSAVKFLTQGNAVSYALAMREGAPTVYVVNQLGTDIVIADEIRAIQFAFAGRDKPSAVVSTYPAGKDTVTRLTLTNAGDTVNVDCIQYGRTLFISMSPLGAHQVEQLPALGMNGTSASLASLTIDLASLLDALDASGGLPLPKEEIASLKKASAGQTISLDVQPSKADNTLDTDLQIPLPVLRELVKIVSALIPTPPPAAP